MLIHTYHYAVMATEDRVRSHRRERDLHARLEGVRRRSELRLEGRRRWSIADLVGLVVTKSRRAVKTRTRPRSRPRDEPLMREERPMATVDDAVQTQARNIEKATGLSIEAWSALVQASGKERHSEILAWLKAEHGFSHGNANLVALTAKRGSVAGGGDALVDTMYAGPLATLRPFHDQVVELARGFGDDVELAPKQAYVSLRRKKQFGTVGPGSGRRLEIGLNLKGVTPAGRLEASSGMCTHRVRLASTDEFDSEVIGWLREAYERA